MSAVPCTGAAAGAALAADPPEVLARRAELMAALPVATVPQDCLLLGNLIEQAATHPERDVVVDDATIARLARALGDPRVFDIALGLSIGQFATGARPVWTLLTRTTPGPLVAHPAVLLAVSLVLDGDGTLAGAALDIAFTADPANPLAQTVRRAVESGIRPHRFRRMLHASFEAAARRPHTPRVFIDPEPF